MYKVINLRWLWFILIFTGIGTEDYHVIILKEQKWSRVQPLAMFMNPFSMIQKYVVIHGDSTTSTLPQTEYSFYTKKLDISNKSKLIEGRQGNPNFQNQTIYFTISP
jgi:hypothetical protein